jgi:hypothetical protein
MLLRRLVEIAAVGLVVLAVTIGSSDVTQPAERAAAFAAQVGMPWGEPTGSEVRDNANDARKAEVVVNYHDFASIGVDPNRGVITSAVDYAAVTEHAASPAEAKLDNAAALSRAQEIVKAAGLEGVLDWEKPTVKLQESSPGVFRYTVTWRPTYKGIPYDLVGAAVMLSAVDGRMLALSTALDVTPPASVEVLVPKDTAVQSAVELVSKADARFVLEEETAELRVVIPNSYWSRYGLGENVSTDLSRVAWVVDLRGKGRSLVFWVDAADGNLLGGTESKGTVSTASPASGSQGIAKSMDSGVIIFAERELARMAPPILVGLGLIVTGWILICRRLKATRPPGH